jgi:hypothetical protein
MGYVMDAITMEYQRHYRSLEPGILNFSSLSSELCRSGHHLITAQIPLAVLRDSINYTC